MCVLKVKVISLPYIFQVLYVLCFTRPRYQVSVYRTIGPLVLIVPGVFDRQHLVDHLESRTTSTRWKGVYDLTEIWKDFGGSCSSM